jgi:hypothetical protein
MRMRKHERKKARGAPGALEERGEWRMQPQEEKGNRTPLRGAPGGENGWRS